MSIRFEATPQRQPTHSYVRCKFHSSRICYNDRRRSKPKATIQTQNVCAYSVCSKTFNPTQTKMSIYAKEFLSIQVAVAEFGHLMWCKTFPVIVFTDNRSVTRFCQAKLIPPALCNACDDVLQNNFCKTQTPSSGRPRRRKMPKLQYTRT